MTPKIKIFLIEWSTPILKEAAKELQKAGAEIVYWTAKESFKEEIKKDFPALFFQSVSQAVRGVGAEGFDCSVFEPLDGKLLEKLSFCESQVLTMMNRMDYSDVAFHRRKHLYYELVKYWFNVLRLLKPQAVVFSVVPHMIYDYILYCLAKEMGVETIMFDAIKVPDRLLLFKTIEENGKKAGEIAGFSANVRPEDLPEDLKDYYRQMTNREKDYYPFDIPGRRFQKKEPLYLFPSLKSVLESIKDRSFFKRVLVRFKGPFGIFFRKSCLTSFDNDFKGLEFWRQKRSWRKKKKNFKKEHIKIEKEADFNKKFVFVPLQYQPERSTSPMGGVFVEQLLMLDVLSAALPDNWVIYVKEHPSQWAVKGVHGHQGRYKGYYQRVAGFKNVKLVPMSTSAPKLIQKCQAVATVTGTAAWEAVLCGKPALVFGWPFYQHCHGVFKVRGVKECEEAFALIKQGFKAERQKVLNFLDALDKSSIKARLGTRFEQKPEVSDKDSAKNIAQAIGEELGFVL